MVVVVVVVGAAVVVVVVVVVVGAAVVVVVGGGGTNSPSKKWYGVTDSFVELGNVDTKNMEESPLIDTPFPVILKSTSPVMRLSKCHVLFEKV